MDGGRGAIGREAVRGMIFAASDLHGFPLVRFMNGLKAIGFGENDFLYILGDVVDRHGDGGAAMLRWMSLQRNMQLLMGNHEYMMLSCAEMLYDASPACVKRLSREQLRTFLHWSDNGGTATLNGFAVLR
jgi:serine/threonine protein phosphatase 1